MIPCVDVGNCFKARQRVASTYWNFKPPSSSTVINIDLEQVEAYGLARYVALSLLCFFSFSSPWTSTFGGSFNWGNGLQMLWIHPLLRAYYFVFRLYTNARWCLGWLGPGYGL